MFLGVLSSRLCVCLSLCFSDVPFLRPRCVLLLLVPVELSSHVIFLPLSEEPVTHPFVGGGLVETLLTAAVASLLAIFVFVRLANGTKDELSFFLLWVPLVVSSTLLAIKLVLDVRKARDSRGKRTQAWGIFWREVFGTLKDPHQLQRTSPPGLRLLVCVLVALLGLVVLLSLLWFFVWR